MGGGREGGFQDPGDGQEKIGALGVLGTGQSSGGRESLEGFCFSRASRTPASEHHGCNSKSGSLLPLFPSYACQALQPYQHASILTLGWWFPKIATMLTFSYTTISKELARCCLVLLNIHNQMIMNVFREFIVSVAPQVIGVEAPMIGVGVGYCRKMQCTLLSRSLDWEPQVIGLGYGHGKERKRYS